MELKDAVRTLSALAQDSRLAVFRLLVEAGPEGLAAGAVARRLEMPANTLSFHLAQLAGAGLVRQRRRGRTVIYAADYAGMGRLMDFLTENCCRAGDAACAPPPEDKGRLAS